MKFDIPEEWCKKWAQLELESDGVCTIPINPQRMAEFAAKAQRKRTDELLAAAPQAGERG